MLIVLVLPGILFPPKKTADRRTGGQAVGDTARASNAAPAAPILPELAAAPSVCPPVRSSAPGSAAAPAEPVWVSSPRARFGFSGARARRGHAGPPDYK